MMLSSSNPLNFVKKKKKYIVQIDTTEKEISIAFSLKKNYFALS